MLSYAYAVIAIGKTAEGGRSLLLVIGYLPYLALFDLLVQSTSRALHLYRPHALGRAAPFRTLHAVLALALLVGSIVLAQGHAWARIALIVAAWPLGAVCYIWESTISSRTRQGLAALLEIAMLMGAMLAHRLVPGAMVPLLCCLITAPFARILVILLSRPRRMPDAPVKSARGADQQNGDAPHVRRRLGSYITASIGQQALGSTAATLPAIYAQISGDVSHLALQLALFRSVQSAAAVVSLAVNTMSSRIFFNTVDPGVTRLESAILRQAKWIARGLFVLAGLIALLVIFAWPSPAWVAVGLLPVMAVVNVESSLLYNRGLPTYTLHCQAMILNLSMVLLFVLIGMRIAALSALALFVGHFSFVFSTILSKHLQQLSSEP